MTGLTSADKNIRIGYLSSKMNRAGAINVAVERAQNDGLLRDYNIRYYAVDSFSWKTEVQNMAMFWTYTCSQLIALVLVVVHIFILSDQFKGKAEHLYSALHGIQTTLKRSGIDHTV